VIKFDRLNESIDRLASRVIPSVEFLTEYQQLLEEEIDILSGKIEALEVELSLCTEYCDNLPEIEARVGA